MNVFFISLFAVLIHGFGSASHSGPNCKPGEPVVSNLIISSADGGKTWTDLSKGLPNVKELRHVLVTGKDTYVTVGNNHLYKLVSAGVWQKENIGGSMMGTVMSQDSSYQPNFFLGIFEGKDGPYVSVHESGLYQRTATGYWQAVHTDLPDNRIYNIIELEDGSTLVGTEGGIFKKTGKGGSWVNVLSTKWASNMTHHGAVVVTSSPTGIWVSDNYGSNWTNTLKDKMGNYALCATADKIYAIRPYVDAANNQESDQITETAFMSSDQGKTWTPINKGLLQVDRLYQVIQSGNMLISSNSQGIGISNDHGYNWENVFEKPGTDKMMIWRLVNQGSVIYAVKGSSGC
ncbi:MAG: hypothetical protein U0V54_11590 [Saprospiraceae bacterium]|nr:hypothetical protein [Saprospiraceae bacterium]